MQPLTDEQKQAILDAEKAVVELLTSRGMHLEGVAVLRNGSVDVQIVLALNAPEPQAEQVTAAPAFRVDPADTTANEAAPAA